MGSNLKNKKSSKGELMIEEPRCKLGSNSRIQFASNESKLVAMNSWKVDLIFENGVQISFSLLTCYTIILQSKK
jgi:hypothetical protein